MDRRQKKTRKGIYEAFEQLMIEEHYQEITVAQIIERADIGRSTFYAHFETKDNLLDQMCNEMFDHIFEGVNEHCVTHADLRDTDLQGVLAHLLYHLRDTHKAVCGKLLSEGEPHFTTYFDNELKVLFERKMDLAAVALPHDLLLSLWTSSFREAITWWFAAGTQAAPEQLAQWFLDAWSHPEYQAAVL